VNARNAVCLGHPSIPRPERFLVVFPSRAGRTALRANAMKLFPADRPDFTARFSAEGTEASSENKSERLYNLYRNRIGRFDSIPRTISLRFSI
jgi:hypothetical protein